jgi:long-chain acyl-CoA synthetase
MAKLIRDILGDSQKNYADIPAVKWLKKKEVLERNYSKLAEQVVAVRKGLLVEGFAGKHIALIGTSSVEWIEAYLGVVTGQTVAVPLDAGLPAEDLVDLINRSDSEALFISPKNKGILESVLSQCPKLRKIWILKEEETASDVKDSSSEGTVTEGDTVANSQLSDKIFSISQLINTGKNSEKDSPAPEADDIATIIFTSGTTGKSKGVMLTQNNLASNVEAVDYTSEPGTVMLSVLPIHHAFCLVMDWLKGFSLGATVCINDSLLHIVRNMGIFKPYVILMVPMMIETIYKRLAVADSNIPKKLIADNVFGGNLKIIFTGGAHLDPYYIDKFAEYGVDVLEGYGMSECSPVISSNLPEDHKKGSIGRPLKNAEISFENGEILVRGSSVMKGYYQMPEETAETLKDGWLHTGDKGYLDEDGFLFINGRVKNLIILSNGENISPEEIENKLALNPLIGEVIVTGENNGLTARIYPEQELVAAKGLDEDTVRTELQAFLDTYNKNQPTYRQITGLVVRKNPFIRSSTKKIKRQEALIDEPVK